MTKTITETPCRHALQDGEILTVKTLSSGAKVLVDFANRDEVNEVVELQLHRRVRLVGLPTHVQREFAVPENVKAIHVRVPFLGNASAFSFDGSTRRAVCLQCLPDGQIIHVLPDVIAGAAVIRLPAPRPELPSRVAAYAYA